MSLDQQPQIAQTPNETFFASGIEKTGSAPGDGAYPDTDDSPKAGRSVRPDHRPWSGSSRPPGSRASWPGREGSKLDIKDDPEPDPRG